MKTFLRLSVWQSLGLLLVLISAGAAVSSPLGTDFTYQGKLDLSGTPVSGTADFQFKLFGVASGGTQIGSMVPVNNVAVVTGVFTVTLDFGASAFNGDERWLDISVRSPAGSGSFIPLTPRQEVTASPYTLKARGIDGHSLDASDGSPVDALFVGPTGNVGVGTASPAATLHVKTPEEGVRIEGSGAGSANMAWIGFNDSNEALGWVGDGSSQDSNTYLASYVADVILYTTHAVLTAKRDGKVGVGTQFPDAGLHVRNEPMTYGGTLALEGETHCYMSFFPDGAGAGRKAFFGYAGATHSDITMWNEIPGGDINLVTTNGGATTVTVLEITGADLAEKFPTSDKVEPGMVVAINSDNSGNLCLARGAYNRRVAGVVSGANDFSAGAVLGNLPGQEDSPPIALSGRCYVWCDASIAPIEAGDLLTTSERPGHAMKAADHIRSQGAVLGKAMTGLESGRGMVLVLVNLQ